MPTPRRESATGPIPCSALVLERRLLVAYHELYQQQVGQLWPPERRRSAAAAALADVARAHTRNGYAEARLREALPEVIQRLRPDQQPALAALLLTDSPELPAVVALLVNLERSLNYSDDDPALKRHDDDWKTAATGQGRFRPRLAGTALAQKQARQQAELRRGLGEPLVLVAWVPVGGRARRARRRRVVKPGGGAGRQLQIWP